MDNVNAPMLGKMVEADFEKGTVTLQMIGPYYASAQVYELVPVPKAESVSGLES